MCYCIIRLNQVNALIKGNTKKNRLLFPMVVLFEVVTSIHQMAVFNIPAGTVYSTVDCNNMVVHGALH